MLDTYLSVAILLSIPIQMTLRVIGLQGERDVLDSSTSRSVDAMRLLARVALGMSQRCRQLAQQKTFLLRQARATQKLQVCPLASIPSPRRFSNALSVGTFLGPRVVNAVTLVLYFISGR